MKESTIRWLAKDEKPKLELYLRDKRQLELYVKQDGGYMNHYMITLNNVAVWVDSSPDTQDEITEFVRKRHKVMIPPKGNDFDWDCDAWKDSPVPVSLNEAIELYKLHVSETSRHKEERSAQAGI